MALTGNLVCRQVQDITHDVKSFVFAAPDGRPFEFEAGQFVTLDLDIDGQRLKRCYTISSPPTRPHRLAITVKRVVGGPVSNWLHDTVTTGTRIAASAPAGSFTIAEHPARKYLFLSAGSGITPLMSMTRTAYDLGLDADILFVHSARTPADIIFRGELDAMAAVMPNLRVAFICEGLGQGWTGLRGRLSGALLQSLVPDLAERVAFTCGPAGYMSSVRSILGELGYDLGNYHEESFSIEDPAPALSDEAADVAMYKIEFVRSGRTITCAGGENILDAAVAAGMRPASSCTQGLCGTCKTSLLSGEVDMRHNGGIRPKEIAQHKILICCSKPLSDLRIEC